MCAALLTAPLDITCDPGTYFSAPGAFVTSSFTSASTGDLIADDIKCSGATPTTALSGVTATGAVALLQQTVHSGSGLAAVESPAVLVFGADVFTCPHTAGEFQSRYVSQRPPDSGPQYVGSVHAVNGCGSTSSSAFSLAFVGSVVITLA